MAKTALIAGLMSVIFLFDAHAFPALTVLQAENSDIVPVRGFCGLGFHRGPYGGCVRNGVPYGYVPPVVVAPASVVAPIVCPFGYVYSPRYGRCLVL